MERQSMRPKPVTPEVELPAPADESTIAPKRTTVSRRRDNDRQGGSADWAPLLELSREAVRAGLSAGGYEGAAIDGAEQDFFDWIEPHAHSSRPGQGFRPWLVERLEQFLTEHPAIEASTDAGTDSAAEAPCPVCGAAAAVRLENGECA